jgi:hypothetical protein
VGIHLSHGADWEEAKRWFHLPEYGAKSLPGYFARTGYEDG